MRFLLFGLVFALFFVSCGEKSESTTTAKTEIKSSGKLQFEDIEYNVDGVDYKSFIVYDASTKEARPSIIILPEMWGMDEFAKNKAVEFAELGYFVLVIDYYGAGISVEDYEDAKSRSEYLESVPINFKFMFDNAKARFLRYEEADYSKIGVVGYGFGGLLAMNMVRQERDFPAAVSVYGHLVSGVKPKHRKAKYLILHADDDAYVSSEEVNEFKNEMDERQIEFKLVNYPNAKHGFANPNSTKLGEKFNLDIAYDPETDAKSWEEIKAFLEDALN